MKNNKGCLNNYLLIALSASSIFSTITTSLAQPSAAQTTSRTFYVSPTGNDSNDGFSTTTPFATIQKAADLTAPGDTVVIMPGIYTNTTPLGDVVQIRRSGSSSAWIKYQAQPGAKLQFDGWNGIRVAGASYIEVSGFQVIGNNAKVTLDYAQSQKTNLHNPLTSGNCILINKRQSSSGAVNYPHNIKIANNKVQDCGGGGIASLNADYLTVSNNIVSNTSWYSPYANSGISMYQNRNSDKNTGYKMYVTNNLVYGNRQYVPSYYHGGVITDGNGIIVDDSRNTQKNSTLGVYKGRTYIANNIVFNNGGRGIITYLSDRVDIINNTTYMNAQSPELKGEIFPNASNDINMYNNILYSLPGKPINPVSQTTNFNYGYNIYFNGNIASPPGQSDKIIDPQFVYPSTDPALANFKLQMNSLALNTGTSRLAPDGDFDDQPRPSGLGYDIGAYED